MRCRDLHELAICAYPKGFLFSSLLSVAPYCVRGGVKVVSNHVTNSIADVPWRKRGNLIPPPQAGQHQATDYARGILIPT